MQPCNEPGEPGERSNAMSRINTLRCRSIMEPPCDQIAVALILVESETFATTPMNSAESVPIIEALPLCAEHAPEAAHEVASSMADDEYLIIHLPAFGVGELS